MKRFAVICSALLFVGSLAAAMLELAPADAVPLRPAPAALLVPCLGFNEERYRLGYGGGYYDRTLEHAPRPRTLGIAYACLQAQFASGPYDIALDHIVTEGDLYR